MCAKCLDEVVGMLFSFVFDPEIIDCECELYGSCDMFPEPGRVCDLEVSKWSETLFEELVC